MAAVLIATACIVDDTDLPCRGDCECPSGQYCTHRVCSASKPSEPASGNQDGPCNSDGTCLDTLVCVDDACGKKYCRQACVTTVSDADAVCAKGMVCVSRGQTGGGGPVWDGGSLLSEGVCVP